MNRRRRTFVYLLVATASLMMSSCNKEKDSEPAFETFSFEGIKGSADIDVKEHTVHAIAQNHVNLEAIAPLFTLTKGATAKVNGVEQVSGITTNNFSNPVDYLLTGEDGTTVTWKVSIEKEASSLGLKAATIRYVDNNGNEQYMCFDNYGKQRRWEGGNEDGWGIVIYDEINNNYHIWSSDPDGPGWIPDEYVSASGALILAGVFLVETMQTPYQYWNLVPGATKTTETIAGQTCDVYRIPGNDAVAEFGVWADMVMLRISDNSTGLVEATSARTGCPANAFTKTVTINWE